MEEKFVIRNSSFVINKQGFTLIEMLIALSILVLVLMSVSPYLRTVQKSWEADSELSNMAAKARAAIDKITDELKQTNSIIDATTVGLGASLDSNYVVFATSGEEFMLDDRNGDFSTRGTGLWFEGKSSGGYGGDYLDSSNTAFASWGINTVLQGNYDAYTYYISTTGTASYQVYDDGFDVANQKFSTTNWLQTYQPSQWNKIDSTAFSLSSGSGSGSDFVKVTAQTNRVIADGIKLIYRGNWHKVLYYDATGNTITFGSCAPSSVAICTPAVNPILLQNVYPINGDAVTNPVFKFFQADGTTIAVNPQDVGLIRIQFEVRDPDGKVKPYILRTEVAVKTEKFSRKLIINEINIQTPEQVIGYDNFDGAVANMDNDDLNWATETAVKDYGWISMLENLDDGEADQPAGWFAGGVGVWATEVDATAPKPAGNRIYSGTGNGSDNHRNNRFFYESSQNEKFEFQYRVSAQGGLIADASGGGGAQKCSTFGVYLRAELPTGDNNNIVFVEFLRKGAVCAAGTAYVRIAKYEGGWLQISGNIAINNNYDDGNWHMVKIQDVWGKVHIFLDGTRVTNVNGICYNSTTSCANALNQTINNTNLVPRRKAIFVWSNTHTHFDDIKITSYDFKPIAYLTDFEGIYSDWFSCIPDYVGPLQCKAPGSPTTCGWAINTITSGPGAAYSGTKAASTNPAGNYNQDCDEEWYHRAAIDMQPSILRFSFPFVHFFSWQDYPAAQTADCASTERGDSTINRYYMNEANVFPLDANGQLITAPLNGFLVPPNSYDATCSNINTFINGKRTWTNNHQPGWTEIAYTIPEQNISTVMRIVFHFTSDNTATTATGHYVDDVSVFPGGEWERITTPSGPGNCYNGTYCWATIDNADYSNLQNNALETPTVITPAWTQEVTLSWVQYRDFEGTVAAPTFYDGGFVEYSQDNGKTWTQFTDLQLSVAYDPCVIGSDPDTLSATYCTIPDLLNGCNGATTFCNELQGYEGWTYDDTTWTRITATLTGANFANKEMKFRFHFGSDGSNADRGWFIDDLKVVASPQTNYDWIEIYNPTPYNVDLNNWRIYMEHSYQDAPTQYDVISGDASMGSGSTVIGPYGYAIITANTPAGSTNVYDGNFFTVPAEDSLARRLTIDDNTFGTLGLRNKFGKIKITDNQDKLIDEVDYNLVFYDDMENYTQNNSWLYKYSVQDWGNPTHWAVGIPTSGSGPGKEHTRNSPGTGKSWYLCIDPTNTTCEDYTNGDETGLIPQSFDLTKTTASNPPYMEFYFWNNVDNNNRRDGMIVEVSQQGGSDFIQDPANPDLIQLGGGLLNPSYYTRTVNQASNVLNGLYAYSRDINNWTKITANLTNYMSSVVNLRFMFGADNGTSAGGSLIDDIAVYYDWGKLNTNWNGITSVLTNTLERINWQGDSNNASNWSASTAPYDTAPNVGTPNQKNSVTP